LNIIALDTPAMLYFTAPGSAGQGSVGSYSGSRIAAPPEPVLLSGVFLKKTPPFPALKRAREFWNRSGSAGSTYGAGQGHHGSKPDTVKAVSLAAFGLANKPPSRQKKQAHLAHLPQFAVVEM
jgi:hypothetical protein